MKLLEVARIGKPHGLKGEVAVHLITNILERIEPGSVLYLQDKSEMVIKSSKQHKHHYLALFEGITSRTSVEAIVGEKLFGQPIEDEETMWVHELIGKDVVDGSGRGIGSVVAIETNPASDLLVLEEGVVIPLIFMVGQVEQIIHVDIPPGLL